MIERDTYGLVVLDKNLGRHSLGENRQILPRQGGFQIGAGCAGSASTI